MHVSIYLYITAPCTTRRRKEEGPHTDARIYYMDQSKRRLPPLELAATIFLFLAAARAASGSKNGGCGKRGRLWVFGDSYADTGNLGDLGRELTHAWYDPYGVTFPGRPSGRFSDGRVLTDFVASIMGIQTPVAYKLRKGASAGMLARGMNFAVGGAGVLDTGNFQRNVSAQIDLLESQLASRPLSAGCDVRQGVALVVVSGNDYSYVAERDNSTSAAIAYIPKVVRLLREDLRRLRVIGMRKVVVTNLHPIGCTPLFTRPLNYTGCDALANMGSVQHNTALQSVLAGLDPTNRTFLLLDLNGPFTAFVSPSSSDQGDGGLKKFQNPRRPCCESFSPDGYCGEEDENGNKQYALCDHPDQHFYWDDVHPTQAAWSAISETFRAKIIDFLST